jgi:hypothetical protein
MTSPAGKKLGPAQVRPAAAIVGARLSIRRSGGLSSGGDTPRLEIEPL